MNYIFQSKRLYLVNDRKWFKSFTDYEVDQWVSIRKIPTLDEVLEPWFTDDEFMDGVLDKDEAKFETEKAYWLESLSLYDIAKNIQNLCSFNLADMYESKNSKTMKLRIKEEYDDTTTISSGLRRKLNKIAQRYSKWLSPKELRGFYDEISELGVTVPAWYYDENDRPHKYLLDGKEVTNSLCVFQTYEGDHGRNEYNIYFS